MAQTNYKGIIAEPFGGLLNWVAKGQKVYFFSLINKSVLASLQLGWFQAMCSVTGWLYISLNISLGFPVTCLGIQLPK